jgi:hypothetical protein
MMSFSKVLPTFSSETVVDEPQLSSRSKFSMILSSSSTVLPLVGLMLTNEFTLLDELADVSGVAMNAVFSTDGPDFMGSKRRVEPRDLT